MGENPIEKELEQAYKHPVFGCLNRLGLEAQSRKGLLGSYILSIDIDKMHSLNAVLKYEGTDALIKRLLTKVRSREGFVAQWLSGDEFLVCLPEAADALQVAKRLLKECEVITQEIRTPENLEACKQASISDPRVVPPREFGFGCTMSVHYLPDVNRDLKGCINKAFSFLSNRKAEGLRGKLV